MPERFRRREKIDVKRPRRMPSRREIKRVLKTGPANKLKKQTDRLKHVKEFKLTPNPKEQVTTVVALSNKLKRRVAIQVRNKLRGDLRKKHKILGMRFKLKNPNFKPEKQKGKLKVKLKGLGGGVSYRKKGSGFEVIVKKGPDKKTPVDARVKARLRIPGQKNTTIRVNYNHLERRFSVSGNYRLKKAGRLMGKRAQLNLRAAAGVTAGGGADYSVQGSYGNRKMQLQVRTDLTYQGGRVAYQVVGGVAFRF
jgi:hypothetical protein